MTDTLTPTASSQAATPMNGAEIVLKALVEQGVEVIFGYPGGAVLPLYDAIFKQNHIKHVLVRHEQAAVHMAEGYARSTGKVGVVLVTSGPGATNAVTGLTDALMDSIPVVCLSGQVPTHLIGGDAFQECDTTGITRPCTKHNYLVKDPKDLARTVHEAFWVASHGRPGPVLIDLPKDVQFAEAPYVSAEEVQHRTYRPRLEPDAAKIAAAVHAILNAKQPIFYTGGGVINAGPEASEKLRKLVRMLGYPITSTLMGLGAYPASDDRFLGMLGMHGTYEANLAMYNCDVMVNVGARFDDRVTGKLDEFSPNSIKIHIDIDPSSINKNVPVDVPIVADAGKALDALIAGVEAAKIKPDGKALDAWWAKIGDWRAKKCLSFRQDTSDGAIIKPQYAIRRLHEMTEERAKTKGDVYITTEVGQHQMWAAQYIGFEQPNRWMTSGGLGTMGYGFPAAVGVQVAHPDALVIDVAGEASTMMNIQELGTLAQYNIPMKMFIVNNEWMGMVRQWQQLLHGERYSESYSEGLPDFVALAAAFGIKGLRARTIGELDGVIREMMDHPGPVVVDCLVTKDENCYPMIPGGHAHYDMLLNSDDEAERPASEDGQVLV